MKTCLNLFLPVVCQLYQNGCRIEAAFRNYFYRADYRQKEDTYDIIVCHANVIRYFVCRYDHDFHLFDFIVF